MKRAVWARRMMGQTFKALDSQRQTPNPGPGRGKRLTISVARPPRAGNAGGTWGGSFGQHSGKVVIQGYLAQKKLPPPLGTPQAHRHRAIVGSYGGGVSYEWYPCNPSECPFVARCVTKSENWKQGEEEGVWTDDRSSLASSLYRSYSVRTGVPRL